MGSPSTVAQLTPFVFCTEKITSPSRWLVVDVVSYGFRPMWQPLVEREIGIQPVPSTRFNAHLSKQAPLAQA
jgi:hypothetical protein